MDFIEVEILNWEKYNPRKDYKKPWWFALSNTITTDEMFSEFSDAEFKAWIHILCTASVQNKDRPLIFFKHAHRAADISRKTLMSAIGKLEILKAIQLPGGICTDSVRDLCSTEQNSTIQNRTNNNAHAEAFALFWAAYPRKVGKGKAGKSYQRLIESGLSSDEISKALSHYLVYLRRERVEAKFIKHGPTFLNEAKDWLDPNHGTSASFATSGATELSAEEAAIFADAETA